MKVLWRYLIKRIEVIVDAWGRYLQGIRGSSEVVCSKSLSRCPFAPILPDRDNLEAMVGDFFEHYEMLLQDNISLPMQFGRTAVCFAVLVFSIVRISVDNYIDNIIGFLKNKVKAPPSDLEEE